MENNLCPPPYRSSRSLYQTLYQTETDTILESPDDNGCLSLKGNPGPWIENSPTSSHHLVKHLALHFSIMGHDHEIADSIYKLALLTHFTIRCANESLSSLPHSIGTLRNLRHLKFEQCMFQKLPSNMGLLNVLTHLALYQCSHIEFLPQSITTLSNLVSFIFDGCNSLKELPACFGRLKSLQHIYLKGSFNHSVKFLPSSMVNLLHLKSLSIDGFSSLTEMPAHLKVAHLRLISCRSIQFIPRGLINLCHLEINPDIFSETSIANLKDSVNLHHLTLVCDDTTEIQNLFPSFRQLVKLHMLSFHTMTAWSNCGIVKGLDDLNIIDIRGSTIKYLAWSITELNKLQILMLPSKFRLETLPSHLSDSVLISVEGKHIRKPWRQLKQELGVSQGKYPSTLAPPGYLYVQQGLGQWTWGSYGPLLWVEILDLELQMGYEIQDIKNSIGKLSYLTHLFVTNGHKNDCLPRTMTGLKHLCLDTCSSMFYPFSLHNLSNLNSLDLIGTTFATEPKLNLPISLKRLSLQSLDICSLPASMASSYNLQTLELRGCYKLTSLSPLNIVTLKIDRIIKSLPIRLRHLEILHVKSDCLDKNRNMYCDSDTLKDCLAHLVNLEMLSLTCYCIKSLPSMAGKCNLRVLLLKDCFSLKELQPDVDKLVELQILDISGTRIKSLPDSIINLSKLQQLILPKCFTRNLPRKLDEVFIIDKTDIRYYEHMGYYDSDFETLTDSSCEGSDDEVGSIKGVDKAIAEDPIQSFIDEESSEKNDVNAQIPIVSSSKMKRGTNEHEKEWPSSKKLKQCHDAKEEGEPNTDSTYIENPSKPIDGLEQTVSKGATAIVETVEKAPWESIKESNMKVPQHVDVHPDGVNQSNIAQPNGSSSSFDFVKACYEGYLVRIDFSLSSSFDELNESVCKKFRLELNKFIIKYLDEDKEWMLMTCIPDLMHALLHTSSTGRKFVRLSVSDNGVVDTKVHLDGANQSTIVQRNGSSSFFDFVKVCYEGDSVWIDFSLTSSFDQLIESICKKFGLEFNKFKIKYLDEDKEWLLMTCVSDLTHAPRHTSSSGRKFVRLSIIDRGVVNTGRASKENNERMIPKESEGRSSRLSVEKSKNIRCIEECSNQRSNTYCNLFPESCVPRIMPFIEGYIDVKADGNCGFRVIATFEYGDEEKWLDVRIDLLKELNTNKDLYKKALGGEEEFERANYIVNWLISPAEKKHWFEATCLGLVVATKYQKVFTCWSTECWTYLPLVSRLIDPKPPTMYINMACINENHFIALHMPNNIPLPPLSPLWKRHRCDTVKHWRTRSFKQQFDDYLQLCN